MAEPYAGMTDILFGYDTDIHFENGDLKTTSGIDYIEREIYKLLITEPGDWRSDTTMGCSPNRYVGEQNTREIAKSLENYIEKGLALTVFPATVDVRVVPSGYDKLICVITVNVEGNEIVRTPFEFDYVAGFRKLLNIDTETEKIKSSQELRINDISKSSTANKYWSRLRDQSR